MAHVLRVFFVSVASFLLLFTISGGVNAKENAAQPNIVVILADDLGYTDLGCYGSKYYETPNIDRMASRGMRFLNYHQCVNCVPSRAALFSGQYGARTGVYTVGTHDWYDWRTRPLKPVANVTQLPLNRDTFAVQVRKAGYATGLFGKWHLGDEGAYHPSRRGFDEAIVTLGKHFEYTTKPWTTIPNDRYLADFITDKSVDFIERNKSKPFLLFVSHFGVHYPYQAKQEWIDKFVSKKPSGGHRSPIYAAMIASVDESVGRILTKLEEVGIAENTLVIFTSDNGGVGGFRREGLLSTLEITDNAPLRSGKGTLFEGGTRVPFIVQWPGNAIANSTCDVPTIHVDLFPTLLEVAGAPQPRQFLDGESLVKLFRDGKAKLQRNAIMQHFPGYLPFNGTIFKTTPSGSIQIGEWKLIEYFEDGKIELYNLKQDLSETRDVANLNPARALYMRSRLWLWRTALNAPMPVPNPH